MYLLDIGEVQAKTGIAASTLRYYEEQGLIQSADRKGLRRQYEPSVVQQLSLIALGKLAGFSLADLRTIFSVGAVPDVPRDMLHQKADALEEQVRQMAWLAKMIRHVAECPEKKHTDCAKFQRLMRLALPARA